VQILDTSPALVSEGKSKKGRVAPDPEKKWKLIRWYDTSNTAMLDPNDRKYDQYQHAREWMEKSGMKMLSEQIPERDKLHLWKLFRSARSASNGVSIQECKCPMRHQSNCRAGLRVVRGNGFEQLERCGSHHLDSHIRKAMSARDTEEEDQDSDYSDLVQDSEDEDAEFNKEEEDEGEDEESEDENDSASDTDASLLGGNLLFAGLILYSLIPIFFAVEEAVDSDEIQSDRFDKDGFDGSGPTSACW
jgi:hypothetical protein